MFKTSSRGRALSLGEGEGRNAVYLASRGFTVTAVDLSRVGLTKAHRLAAKQNVQIETIAADLNTFEIGTSNWDVIISFFCHLPATERITLHQKVIVGLKPGGVYIYEAFAPGQLKFNTGGPRTPELLANIEELKHELKGLTFLKAVERERYIEENRFDSGECAVVQLMAVKPHSIR